MRTGMCWRKADRGYTRQYYCIAVPITQETHIMLEYVKELIRGSLFKGNIFTTMMKDGKLLSFSGGTTIQIPFFEGNNRED
jgi:hypothetical protein